MIRSIIAIVILGVLCCYLFYLNPTSISVNLSTTRAISAPLAIVLISVFFLGALVVGFLAAVFSLFHSFDDWKRDRKYRRESQHREQLILARDHVVTENFQTAQSILEQIVAREPENALAWTSLGEVVQHLSGPAAALAVLDRARLHVPRHAELLFRAASLSESLGNLTGSFDNLKLVLREHPGNTRALRLLMDCSKKLGRYDEAISAARELLKRVQGNAQDRLYSEIADLELAQANTRANQTDIEQRRNEIEDVLRRHREHLPSLAALSEIEKLRGNRSEATRLYSRCFSLSGQASYLFEIAEIWLADSNPAKAIQAVSGAVAAVKSDMLLHQTGLLALTALSIRLGMLDDAWDNLVKFEATLPSHSSPASPSLADTKRVQAALLKGLILLRRHNFQAAAEILPSVSAQLTKMLPDYLATAISDVSISNVSLPRMARRNTGEAPPPELSTP